MGVLVPKVQRGFVLAVSAPSGTGKTSLCDRLARDHTFVVRSISVTTRPQRPGEVSGKDYHFVSLEEFKKRELAGELLETATVFDNWYGTPKAPVQQVIEEGGVLVMDIDTVGALRVKSLLGMDCVTLFMVPPSLDELENRLRLRGKDSPEVLSRRLKEAKREMTEALKYEYVLANVDYERAYRELEGIVQAERLRAPRLNLEALR